MKYAHALMAIAALCLTAACDKCNPDYSAAEQAEIDADTAAEMAMDDEVRDAGIIFVAKKQRVKQNAGKTVSGAITNAVNQYLQVLQTPGATPAQKEAARKSAEASAVKKCIDLGEADGRNLRQYVSAEFTRILAAKVKEIKAKKQAAANKKVAKNAAAANDHDCTADQLAQISAANQAAEDAKDAALDAELATAIAGYTAQDQAAEMQETNSDYADITQLALLDDALASHILGLTAADFVWPAIAAVAAPSALPAAPAGDTASDAGATDAPNGTYLMDDNHVIGVCAAPNDACTMP
jgi:hypothetical protein